MKKLLVYSLILVGCAGLIHQASGQGEDAKLEAFFKTSLDASFRLQPMQATQLGDHRFDAQLEDLAPAARAKWLEQTRDTLADLPKKVDYQKLARAGQIDY